MTLQRVRSAAWRNRNQVARGMRLPCSMDSSAMSSTMAANPPACRSRSVARMAWSSRVHGCDWMDSAVRDEWFGFVEELLLHRTQRRRLRQTPFAAADSGSKESLVSIQAQTLSCVRWARKDIAMLVRPEDMGPV